MTPFTQLSSYSPPLSDITVNYLSRECIGPEIMSAQAGGFASAAWTQNRIIAIPLVVQRPYQVKQFAWYNGGTVNGNTDVGIYDETATRKIGSTGSTANSGTSVIQVVDVTDFTLAANTRYWLVLSSDSATQTYQRINPAAVLMDWVGVREQLSGWSSGLPSSLTLAVPTVAYIPFFGFGRSVL